MIIGIAGYKLFDPLLLSNGYIQNVIFYCEFFEKYFSQHTLVPINSLDFVNKYDHMDLIIEFAPLSRHGAEIAKKKYPNCKKIFVKIGCEYYLDLARLLPKDERNPRSVPKAHYVDQVWICPDYYSTRFYYQSLYDASVKVAPFIWKPDNLENKQPFTQLDYDNTKNEKNIFIVEPNINLFKMALIPIMIVNELWKKDPNSFNKLYIVANNKYSDNDHFIKEFIPKLEVLHARNKKTYFCPRAKFRDIFKKPGVLISHRDLELDLNYIYLEALYLKVQWVHNSSFFNQTEYYYDDKNVFEGVNQLKKALSDWKAIDNSHIIEKYNPDNKEVIYTYEKLINELVQPKISTGEINENDELTNKKHINLN